jgi:flagellar brake protein
MSIENENTHVELMHSDAEAKYLLRDPREINTLLKSLVSGRALVSVKLLPGRESFLSALIEVDDDAGSLLLDGSTDAALNTRIEAAHTLDCVTQLEKIRVQFALSGHQSVSDGGSPGFRASLPTVMLRLQRRDYYRLHTPVTDSVTCTLPLPLPSGGTRDTTVRILDISAGGIAIAVPPEGASFAQGEAVESCMLNLPEAAPIPAKLTVRNVFRMTNRTGVKVLRAGCQFTDIPRGADETIQRYILKIERERSARTHGHL